MTLYSTVNGKPIESSINAVANKMMETILSENPNMNIIVIGMSVGCGPAVKVACTYPNVHSLITFSGWTNIYDVFPSYLRWLVPENIWDSLSLSEGLTKPWLIIHGDSDTTISYKCGVNLHRSAQNSILFTVPGSNDNDAAVMACGLQILRLHCQTLRPTVQALTEEISVVFCHGYNNTNRDVEIQGSNIRDTLINICNNRRVKFHVATWPGLSSRSRETLETAGISPNISVLIGGSSYPTDNSYPHHRLLDIPVSGKFCIVAHSRGCHIIVEWLKMN